MLASWYFTVASIHYSTMPLEMAFDNCNLGIPRNFRTSGNIFNIRLRPAADSTTANSLSDELQLIALFSAAGRRFLRLKNQFEENRDVICQTDTVETDVAVKCRGQQLATSYANLGASFPVIFPLRSIDQCLCGGQGSCLFGIIGWYKNWTLFNFSCSSRIQAGQHVSDSTQLMEMRQC